jgi:hypothetical protein
MSKLQTFLQTKHWPETLKIIKRNGMHVFNKSLMQVNIINFLSECHGTLAGALENNGVPNF